MKHRLTIFTAIAAILSWTSAGFAQGQPAAPQPSTSQSQPGSQTQGQPRQNGQNAQHGMQMDQHIASCLLFGNEEEIALAEFAENHAQNSKVKEFAKMLVEDHKQAVQKLQKFAPHAAQLANNLENENDGNNSTSTNANHHNNQSQNPEHNQQNQAPNQNRQSTAINQGNQQIAYNQPANEQHSGMGQQILMLEKRGTEECLELTKKELTMNEGAKFDHAYLGSQVGAHIAMLAKLKASQEFASGELRQVIQECEATVQKHKQKAEELKKDLKDENSASDKRSS